MPLDVSLEAIEADLMRAEGSGSTAAIAVHLARAQVRATLLAAQPAPHEGRHEALPPDYPLAPVIWTGSVDIRVEDHAGEGHVFYVPAAAAFQDRVEAAAILLGMTPDQLAAGLATVLFPSAQEDEHDEDESQVADVEAPYPHADQDIDADFFAEAKAERKARRK